MDAFAGAEPLVGEVVALRTFRVEETGLLLPLYSEQCWYDGINTAACRTREHPAPADGCDCGFYAYGSTAAADQNRGMRYVRAVVSCWGGVVAGTQGIRAQHARIDALWMHPSAPGWLRRQVSVRYPSARLYDDAERMLTEHPLSALPCYQRPEPRSRASRAGAVAGVFGALALGAVPGDTLHGTPALWAAWLGTVAALSALTLWLIVGARFAGHLVAAGLAAGIVAWLVAPLFGLGGWLLRLPVLRGLLVATGGYLLTLRPRYFPVVAAMRDRPCYGARIAVARQRGP